MLLELSSSVCSEASAAKLSSVSYPEEVYRSTVQSNLDQIFPPEKTNFRYSVYNSAGELLYGNAEVSDDDAQFSFFGSSSDEPAPVTVTKTFSSASEATDFVDSVAANMGAEYKVVKNSLDWQEDGTVVVTIVCSRSTEYRINTMLPSEWAMRDKYFYFDYFLSKLVRNSRLLIFVVLGSAVIAIALLAYLIIASGRRKGDDKVHAMVFDKIPLEVFAGILVLLVFAPNLWFRLSDWFSVMHLTEYQDRFPLSVIVVVYRIVITLWFVLSIAVRCKNRTLFSNTLTARLLGILRSTADLAGRRIPILWRFLAASVILTALEALFIFMPEKKYLIPFWILEKLAFIIMGLRLILSIDRVERGGKRLNDGDFDTQIDVEGMLPSLRNHAENLNGIRQAMRQSLDERMRSERLKAELITNVSHDIKTPLTSVITYVDLLQREGVDCPDAQEYLNVLVRQTGKLKKLVVDQGLDVGFAFDGDADRCIAVDEKGNIVDGDRIMYIYAAYMKRKGTLGDTHVVTTVMSNMGLYRALDELGIGYEQTDVGDRFVYERMRQRGDLLGGEESGHIIFSKFATTGDGLLTAIKIMEAMLGQKRPLSELHEPMESFPHVLVNLRVDNKQATIDDPAVQKALSEARYQLGKNGRVLLRKSGTEPVVRVMSEAAIAESAQEAVAMVTEAIKASGHILQED